MGKEALFCYGTLQSPLVMKAVTGTAYDGTEAILHDWARYRVEKTEYPGIRVEDGGAVFGKLYWGIDEEAFVQLDAFEGDKYERLVVPITLPDGTVQDAWAYAFKNEYLNLLSTDPWDFDRFMQNGLERFINWFVEDRRDLFDRGDL
ncbi:gamma-glutamylcyclotransferase family protein [Desulfogranum marinum]|uniref:gamma-glutamylcyclotransferase family protein n=1 Tax=Desulfogranum marinum TaxID=453220 RepID=UPI0019660761|nr:gamma-glutamylcyclotransferase family protein [Desulfogranum marinum]MBM9511314.1 gamma-glutamylcyclotransferase [Desulfogranum marinum]